ncbi:hypothetical protein [Plantactinospora sp. GCM10030261]|uniref:hypothetical protein n=1 Tax=Plantactinospora sp. GCM10030261 TaxID=3273420 RepID=UPI00361EA8FA
MPSLPADGFSLPLGAAPGVVVALAEVLGCGAGEAVAGDDALGLLVAAGDDALALLVAAGGGAPVVSDPPLQPPATRTTSPSPRTAACFVPRSVIAPF